MGIPVFFASHNPAAGPGNGADVGVARRRNTELTGGRRQHGRWFALVNRIHWLCRQACANRIRARHRCWRGPTKEQGLAGCNAPTGKAARRGNGAGVGVADEGTRACGVQDANMKGRAPGVGVARRWSTGLRDARRQHGRPRSVKKAPGLARSDEGTRACGVHGANMEARAPGKRRRSWRGPTVEQGLAGCTAPTCPVTRGRNRNRKRAAAAALFVSLTSSRFFPPKMQFSIGSL